MDTSEYKCPTCGLNHEQPLFMFSAEACVKALSTKLVEAEQRLTYKTNDLEQKFKLLAQETENALNTLHSQISPKSSKPASSLPQQDKDNMWTRRFK